MEARKAFLGGLVLAWLVCSPALGEGFFNADQQEQMEVAAYSSYRGGKKDFNAEKMGARVQRTLNVLVKFGSHHLMRKGKMEGKVMLAEWEKKYSSVFIAQEIGSLDIGDHEAVAFLLKFYLALESVFGQDRLEKMHLRDIWTLAYAIPVVFEPKRVDISQPEYKLHFVPFSKAVGYWTVMGGCTAYNYLGTPVTTLICDPIAEAGRFVFGAIGDGLSDAIWRGANG
jgi:hypothetical protein